MRKKVLESTAVCFVIGLFLFVFYASMPMRGSSTPVRVDIHFLMIGKSGNFVAYTLGQIVDVNGVQINTTIPKPFIEVTKISNKPRVWETNAEEFIAWEFGGTLYVKDLQQIKDLLLVK